MFGNTRVIAEAIAQGMGSGADVRLVRVAEADDAVLQDADLLVAGGPTHIRSMSRPGTRKGTPSYVGKPGSDLVLEPGASGGPGVREWLNSLGAMSIGAAAFDTRLKAPAVLTGRASRAIARGLSRRGCSLVVEPQSFLVDKANHLLPGEADRARAWGARIISTVGPRERAQA